MGTDEYKKALDAAEKELNTLNAQSDLIEQRRAQLQQTIGALQTLTNVSEQEERTLTDTIRIVVKAASGYISAADVLRGVISMGGKFGGKNAISSVVTILSRLHKDGELEREPGVVGGGYRWRYHAIPVIDMAIRNATGPGSARRSGMRGDEKPKK